LVVVAPSNPVVSIGPILEVPGMRQALAEAPAPAVAVTPLIGGQAVKGPTVEMLRGLGLPADPETVAALYRDFLDVFIFDIRDAPPGERPSGEQLRTGGASGRPVAAEYADTLMAGEAARRRLAREVLRIASSHGATLPLTFLAPPSPP
jgi:LPPG:FO 2-phospho-L-lactate transferase